eukprot:scaffold4235_cov114-Isochrysis_galbana.AAC.4
MGPGGQTADTDTEQRECTCVVSGQRADIHAEQLARTEDRQFCPRERHFAREMGREGRGTGRGCGLSISRVGWGRF